MGILWYSFPSFPWSCEGNWFPFREFCFPHWGNTSQLPNFPRIAPAFRKTPIDWPWFTSFLCSFQYKSQVYIVFEHYAYFMHITRSFENEDSTLCKTKNYKSGEFWGNSGEFWGNQKKSFSFIFTRFPRCEIHFPRGEIKFPWFPQWLPWKLVKSPVKKSKREFTGKGEFPFPFISPSPLQVSIAHKHDIFNIHYWMIKDGFQHYV